MDRNGCSIGTHILSYKPGFTLAQNGQNGHQKKSDDHKTELGHSDHLPENSGRAKLAKRGTS
jgi:hypothetical protein